MSAYKCPANFEEVNAVKNVQLWCTLRLIIFCGFILKVDSNHVLVSGMNQINMRIPHEKTVRQNIQQNNQTQLAQVKSDQHLVNKIQLGKVVRC